MQSGFKVAHYPAVGWLIAIVQTALGETVPLPVWLMLVASGLGCAGTVVRPTQPKLSEYLVIAMGLMSVAAVILIVTSVVRMHE